MLVFWKILQNVLNEWSLKGFVRTTDPNTLKNFGETLVKIFHLIYIDGKNFHERPLYHLALFIYIKSAPEVYFSTGDELSFTF